MSNLIKIDKEYAEWIQNLSKRFRQSQIKASIKVNNEVLGFYWSLGRDIVTMKADDRWKGNFWKNLSQDLKNVLPGVMGFSPRNLQFMRQWYILYSPVINAKQLVSYKGDADAKQLVSHPGADEFCKIFFFVPWGQHITIMQKCNNVREAAFFVEETYSNGWSRSVLLNFLDTDLYERQGRAVTNFKATLPDPQSDLAQEITKDPYNFDFTGITKRYNERELKDALIANIEKLLLELGKGFAYMGREYRMEVGNQEFFADMLFYNTKIHSYIICEVKTDSFQPSYLGQLSGYVSFANHVLKGEGDNPTIGLLICKDKDDVVAKYSLEGYNQPMGISEYELSKIYPKDFKSSLPSIEDIERQLK